MTNPKIPVIAVAGPTASGKSSLAMRLCKDYNGELISCDSMQIYRGMDIGTAKPSLREREEVPHHLIDICDPDVDFSAAAFAELAREAIADVQSRGKMPILCGGTGLYIDALINNTVFFEHGKTDIRSELEKAFAEIFRLGSAKELFEKAGAAAQKQHRLGQLCGRKYSCEG